MQFSYNIYQSIVNNMHGGLAYHSIIFDEAGNPVDYEFLEVNPVFESMIGLSREEIIGKRVTEVTSKIINSSYNWTELYENLVIQNDKIYCKSELSGTEKSCFVNAFSTEKGYFIIIFEDAYELKNNQIALEKQNEQLKGLYEELIATEEELRHQFDELQRNKEYLRLSEEKYRVLVDNSEDMIYSCDLEGRFTAANKKFYEVMGVTDSQVIGKTLSSFVSSGIVLGEWANTIEEALDDRVMVCKENTFILPDGNKQYYSVSVCPITDALGNIIGFTGTNHDITELRSKDETIRHMAYFDVLTNLPNRLLFSERLKTALADSQKNNYKTAVGFIDIDNFKKVNDSLGHMAGDELLKEISGRIEKCLRGNYALARFSGDEFTLFIQNINCSEEVIVVADKIKAVFQDPFLIKENNIYLTSSMGISIYPDDGDDIQELLKNADTAMYKAKEYGKNNYQFYCSSMKEAIFKKVDLEKRLRKAVKNGEFTLYFQPQVNAKTGKIRGFEALIRWVDPELGTISPLEFIPVAEEAGLIIAIGEWVLRTACYKKRKWQEQFESDAVISVNISPLQFKQRNFVHLVKSILEETRLNPEDLELEITESILIESFESVINMLEELRAIGVKVALDDFGTGYSSLNYLKNLPINSLKIDKTFVQDIKVESVEKAIIGSIISLVHKLELEIIAEGIETKEQLEYLILCNCDSIQGYLLSKPVTEEETEEFLRRRYFDLSTVNC